MFIGVTNFFRDREAFRKRCEEGRTFLKLFHFRHGFPGDERPAYGFLVSRHVQREEEPFSLANAAG